MMCPWCPVEHDIDTDQERRAMELHLDTHMTAGAAPETTARRTR